ncbi:hypothetical protein C8R41DRAFT_864005 [Lentinula lateritia]|uniref:Uncharacterized protein n=1 Tax=Lentinula lateritia TaxID=40482 RepID=A0ABQ8VTJ4_9AGAR|nr:hypothetical protein C8R41DRAFT_864005 [Lentinula lateritia]
MQTQSSCGRDDIGVKVQNKKCRRGIRSWGSVHIGISDDNIEITSPKKRDGKSIWNGCKQISKTTCDNDSNQKLLTDLQVVWTQVDSLSREHRRCWDNLAKMENLTRLTINTTTLTWKMIREIVQMENLRGLTLQQVCIIETHEESVEGVLHLEHVRLLDTRWHGLNNKTGLIRACKDLKTLEFTWERSRIRALESGEKWWNETCQSVKVYSRRSSWSSAGCELDAE